MLLTRKDVELDPEPHQPNLLFAISLLPALFAAGYAVVGATAASLSSTRQAALRDSLKGASRRALSRYLGAQEKIETRWLVSRALGLSGTAVLLIWHFRDNGPITWTLAWFGAVVAYALPAELGRQFARPRAEEILPALIRIARVGEWFVALFADPLYYIGRAVAAPSSGREPSATLTENEVELLVNAGELDGSLAHDQSEMIRNVLDFGDVTAEELMVPRTQVDALRSELSLDEIQAEVSRTQHSRYPVYADSIDDIVGILHVKNFFHAVAHGENRTVTEISRKPVAFVPEGQLASSVLREMRSGRHHMAVVVDEFGGVSGILTLEDLLEEIVGDIQDEHDQDEADRIRLLAPHCALVDAATPISDVNRALGTQLPEGDYVSLGGLLVEHLGKVPGQGTSHELFGLKVLIRESDARRIARVELSGVPGKPSHLTTRPPIGIE